MNNYVIYCYCYFFFLGFSIKMLMLCCILVVMYLVFLINWCINMLMYIKRVMIKFDVLIVIKFYMVSDLFFLYS